jgi:hypothetical protein
MESNKFILLFLTTPRCNTYDFARLGYLVRVVEEEEGLPILRRGACSGEGHVVLWKIVIIVRFIVDSQFATGSFASTFTIYATIIDDGINLFLLR